MTRIPGIGWVALLVAAFLAAAVAGIGRTERTGEQLRTAHQATVVAARAVAVADTVFVHDTIARRVVVTAYRTLRDTVRTRLWDTPLVARTLDAADSSQSRSDSTVARAGRAIEAHRILEGALRTELALALRQRPSRFQVAAVATFDLALNVPVAALEGTIRVTNHWTLLARVEQRLTVGEAVHRQLGVRVTF